MRNIGKIFSKICFPGLVLALVLDSTQICAQPDRNEMLQVKEKAEQSPFGFHPAWVQDSHGFLYENAQDIGIRWNRPSRYLFWMFVQKDLAKNEYDWSFYDQMIAGNPSNMHLLMNIAAAPVILISSHQRTGGCLSDRRRDQEQAKQYVREGSYLPKNTDKYTAFVKAAVERYDGDGVKDMPGLKNPIKIWQVDNEPPKNLKDYTELMKITYQAIKTADPDAQVMVGGATGSVSGDVNNYIRKFDQEFLPILRKLNGQYMDILDFHWYGNATGDYRKCKVIYDHLRAALEQTGFPKNLPVWITEMGTYSGRPKQGMGAFPVQTERQQAGDIVKRYVYSLSLGVKKVFLAFGLMEGFKNDDNYFEHTGLIYNGRFGYDQGKGVKKLAYYTYKKMTELLEGSDWNHMETVKEEQNDTYGIFLYRFLKDKMPIYVGWYDCYDERKCNQMNINPRVTIILKEVGQIKITEAVPELESGKEVKDYAMAFHTEIKEVQNGEVTITLSNNPVLVQGYYK